MPIPNDYREIVSMLSEKTEEGVLGWKDTTLHILVEINESQFRLWAGLDEHSEEPFVAFGLFDMEGKALDSWYVDESDHDYPSVYRLYRAAKRHAAGVPALLKSLAEQISAMKK